MVHSITARDCPPVLRTVIISMPKPRKIIEYCKIFLPEKVMPA